MGKYLDKIRQHEGAQPIERVKPKEALTPQPELVPTPPTLHPGDQITWTRGDGRVQTGLVDDIHVDADGATWVFCTVPGGSWSAVNAKFAKVRPDTDLTRGATAQADACFACGSTRRWVSIHGAVICAECHPPVCPALVVRWIEDGTQ